MSKNIGILSSARILGSDKFVIWDCYSSHYSTYNEKLHFHDFYELSLIYEGSSDFLVNGEQIQLLPGTIHMVTPSDYHMQLTGEGESFRYINVIFSPELLNDKLATALEEHEGPICIHPIESVSREIFSLAQKLLREYESLGSKQPSPFCEELIHHGIETLCIYIARLIGSSSPDNQDDLLPIRRALSIIRRSYRQSITLQEIADKVFLSPTYFSQLFHKTVGVSFSSYLTDYRLQIASRYLSNNTLLLKEIAPLCGFPTFTNFSAAFKKRYGVSPAAYRRKIVGSTKKES